MPCAKHHDEVTAVPKIVNKAISRMHKCSPDAYRRIVKNHKKMVAPRFHNDFLHLVEEKMKEKGWVFPDE